MSLLASLRGLVRSEEDLATAAVAHVLATSSAVAAALCAHIGIDSSSSWSTQHIFDDGEGLRGRPDLVASVGVIDVAFIEAKFSAGLTLAQPVGYLERLGPGGHLVFLVPHSRLQYLAREIHARLESAGFHLKPGDGSLLRWNVTGADGAQKTLSIMSWDTLLGVMSDATSDAEHATVRIDVVQIRGLVESIEGEAFMPITSQQLTSGEIPRVILQIRRLMGDLRDALVGEDFVVQGNFSVRSSGWGGFDVERNGLTWTINESWKSWREHGTTPVWLTLSAGARKHHADLLRPWLQGAPSVGIVLHSWDDSPIAAPIRIPPDEDHEAVISSMMSQIIALIRAAEEMAASS